MKVQFVSCIMSIYFDFDVGPTGRRFRRAVHADKHDIQLFWRQEHTVPLFGDVDIGSLIELSPLSICMINEKKEVMGFMALSDYPTIPAVDPANWETWIRNMFERFYLASDTLFIAFMCCKDEVLDVFVEEALVTVFNNDSYLKYVVLLVPGNCPEDCYMKYRAYRRNMHKFFAKCDHEEEVAFNFLFTAMRQDFCPKLRMRRAVEEDNDDIVEILDKRCPRLKDLYGEYYVSEIIGRHPEMDRHIIVAENQDKVVGMMCLNSEINYKKLQSMYELDLFQGLRKATPFEKEQYKRSNSLLNTFGEPIMHGKWSPFSRMAKLETIHMDDVSSNHKEPSREKIDDTKPRKLSRVNFDHDTFRRSIEQEIRQHDSDDFSDKLFVNSPTQSQATTYSITDLLEADPFDYEIVNIDDNLLTIPEVSSVEHFCKSNQECWRRARISIMQKRRQSFKCSGRRCSIFKPSKSEDTPKTLYRGGPNAFMIELFGLREDIHEGHAFDLLEAAFEMMKSYDYCIIRVPCADKTFALLQHFCYVPVKADVCCDYALYVAHRSSVTGKLRVREAELVDIPQIAHLMRNLDGKETIWTIENNIQQEKRNGVYVFQCGMSIVGVGILEPPEQIDLIRAKFELEKYHIHKYHLASNGPTYGFTTLKALLVYPVFEVHYRFFAREMMRLSGGNALLWLTAYRNKWVAHKANCLVSAMIPLMPRRFEIDCVSIPELKKISNLSRNIMAFASWFISKKYTTIPKMTVNVRIVVVGASRTAMAFLNTLLFSDTSTYLTFTNITLISPCGLPYVRHSKSFAETMFPKYRTSMDKFMKSVPYTYYLDIVQGTVVEIDKTKKFVTLSNDRKYYYDLLFLLFGKQYQNPDYFHGLHSCRKDSVDVCEPTYIPLDAPRNNDNIQITADYLPDNVFVVNDIGDANKALSYVKNKYWQDCEYKVIVYGASIHAYCCLATLVEMGIPAGNIVFVEPFPPEDPKKPRVPVFCNPYVDQTVREVLCTLNITVYSSYYFKSWSLNHENVATQVEFLSNFKILRLNCSAMFYYGKKGISAQAFVAINKSGIAYDGGILIDHQFRTHDPSIYAAGPVTRYYRRYFAEEKKQKYYDSYEVGQKLGTLIRNMCDPLFTTNENHRRKIVSFDLTSKDSSSSSEKVASETSKCALSKDPLEKDDRLPDLRKPIVVCCTLPGGLHYLEVRSPGIKNPHYYVQSLHYNGYVMETFKNGYFKLHLNNDHVVDGVTCLTSEKYPLENYKNLYGLSATVLNNVYLRYTAKKLDDFYEFFRKPWAYFLYLGDVDELFATIKQLYPKGEIKGETLGQVLFAVGKRISDSSSKSRTKLEIRSAFEKSHHVDAIIDYVLEWISHHDILLPMYLHPSTNIQFTHDLVRNAAFRKKKTNVATMIAKLI